MSEDTVDRILAEWARERPDLDASPMGVIGRFHRMALLLDEELSPVFAAAGLGPGDFDVLSALRRAGAPYELSASELATSTMVTSGATTKRVDRLVVAGLAERRVGESDGRSRLIRLTPRGVEVVDRVVEEHLANERRLLSGFSERDQRQLVALLRRWRAAVEQ